jgi:B12-binding domain/radical SAM domain protein
MRDDLVLIHAPAIYDFRERSMLFGPISDVIPSTPVFEMYPIGFATMSCYLSRRGHRVRIANLAVKMLASRFFRPERYLRKFHPVLFGLDLHWLPHVQGVVEVAKILKGIHPRTPIVLGGLSSSYFHREILENYPEIDFVIRGDCAEEPLEKLLSALKSGAGVEDVPNLTYRAKDGSIAGGDITHVPGDLDSSPLDYRHMMRQVVRRGAFRSYSPFKNWFSYPITAILTCKGCTHSCVTCGGSIHANRRVVNRHSVAYKNPRAVAREVASVTPFINGPVFFLGDFLQGGGARYSALMDALRPLKIQNEVVVEFFRPPDREVVADLARSFPRFNIQISPESHDEEVRRAFGRPYGNAELEGFLREAVRHKCGRVDLFFMTGLGRQTAESALGTVDYCRTLLSEFGRGGRVAPFISPLAPFVDPGSAVFEEPERFGYRLRCRTLEQHRRAMLSFSWKGMLNYETEWMTRDQMVTATYQAGVGLTRLKAEFGLLPRNEEERVIRRAETAMALLGDLEAAEALPPPRSYEMLAALRRRLEGNSESSVCEKRELAWKVGISRMNLPRLIGLLLSGREH